MSVATLATEGTHAAHDTTTSEVIQPSNTRIVMFQLDESNDLARITSILQAVALKSQETIKTFVQKYKLDVKI